LIGTKDLENIETIQNSIDEASQVIQTDKENEKDENISNTVSNQNESISNDSVPIETNNTY